MLRLRASKIALEALVGEARLLAGTTTSFLPSSTSTSAVVVQPSSTPSNASLSTSSFASMSSRAATSDARECFTSVSAREEAAFECEFPSSCSTSEPTLIIGRRWKFESLASSSSAISSSFAATATSSAYQSLLWQHQRRWMAVPKKKSSLHRRGMRNAGKFVRRTESIAKCSRCSALMHPMQVPHYFCDDDACPSKVAGGGGSGAASAASVAATTSTTEAS